MTKDEQSAELTAQLALERVTTNTVRYEELLGEDGTVVMGTLYVRQRALRKLGEKRPQMLEVTIRVLDTED